MELDIRTRGKVTWTNYHQLEHIVEGAGFGRSRFLQLAESCCGAAFHYNFETHASTAKEDLRVDAQQKRLYRSILGLPFP